MRPLRPDRSCTLVEAMPMPRVSPIATTAARPTNHPFTTPSTRNHLRENRPATDNQTHPSRPDRLRRTPWTYPVVLHIWLSPQLRIQPVLDQSYSPNQKTQSLNDWPPLTQIRWSPTRICRYSHACRPLIAEVHQKTAHDRRQSPARRSHHPRGSLALFSKATSSSTRVGTSPFPKVGVAHALRPCRMFADYYWKSSGLETKTEATSLSSSDRQPMRKPPLNVPFLRKM
jgi:hypothetical protein